MKTTILSIIGCLLFTLLSVIPAKAQQEPVSGKLPITGFVTVNGKKAKSSSVRIYDGNNLWQEFNPDKKGFFELMLDLNKHYTFEFLSDGMLTKRIAINTHVDKKTAKPVPFECYVDLMPLEQFDGKDISTLDFPVAIVKYNAKKRMFEPELGYTMNMLKEIQRVSAAN